ncbi:hypothetical protein [Flavobacterium sp.]|uniref:hypothetical protein n=1 Tax=Flavobacterium sp. TaxID=239 RepID=UPI002607044D|nr:hypothetical protein [Flavobacterium sp.]
MKINSLHRWQIALLLLFAVTTTNAQETSFNPNTLESQFDYILTKSENYRDLKIVKTKWLEDLKQNVTSSFVDVEKQLLDSKTVAQQQKSEMAQLKSELQTTTASLSKYTNAGPTVTFLGIEFDQIVFGTLFSILFFGSLILACILAIKFNKSNELTKSAKSVLSELEEEYQEYKRRTIEREQKISRQLQDEINKQKQFLQRNAS